MPRGYPLPILSLLSARSEGPPGTSTLHPDPTPPPRSSGLTLSPFPSRRCGCSGDPHSPVPAAEPLPAALLAQVGAGLRGAQRCCGAAFNGAGGGGAALLCSARRSAGGAEGPPHDRGTWASGRWAQVEAHRQGGVGVGRRKSDCRQGEAFWVGWFVFLPFSALRLLSASRKSPKHPASFLPFEHHRAGSLESFLAGAAEPLVQLPAATSDVLCCSNGEHHLQAPGNRASQPLISALTLHSGGGSHL